MGLNILYAKLDLRYSDTTFPIDTPIVLRALCLYLLSILKADVVERHSSMDTEAYLSRLMTIRCPRRAGFPSR